MKNYKGDITTMTLIMNHSVISQLCVVNSNVRILSLLQKCILGNKMMSAVTILFLSGIQLLHCQGDHGSLNQVTWWQKFLQKNFIK